MGLDGMTQRPAASAFVLKRPWSPMSPSNWRLYASTTNSSPSPRSPMTMQEQRLDRRVDFHRRRARRTAAQQAGACQASRQSGRNSQGGGSGSDCLSELLWVCGDGVKDIPSAFSRGCHEGSEGCEVGGAFEGPEGSGDFHFDLHHAQRLFGEVVCEGDVEVGEEAQDRPVWRASSTVRLASSRRSRIGSAQSS